MPLRLFQGTPLHERSGNQPTPDPSQEGNWPAGVAPLLGGAGGGFRGTMRAQNSGKSLLSPLLRLPAAPLRSAAQAGRGERKQKRAPKICVHPRSSAVVQNQLDRKSVV